MDLQLFKVLQVIIKEYSRQPVKHLIDDYLRIKIIVKCTNTHLQELIKSLKLTTAEQVVFCNKNRSDKSKQYIIVCFTHPLKLALAKHFFKVCQTCIVVQDDGQINNIMQVNTENDKKGARAVILKTYLPQFQELTNHLDAYLSVCQVFFGHLHMVVSCFEDSVMYKIIQEIHFGGQDDQFSDFRQGGFFKMLEERASKITLQELSETCRISRNMWGEILVFDGGQDALIVWIAKNKLPFLNLVPNFTLNKKYLKTMQTFLETNYGLKIFKKKELMKQKLQNLQASIIIFNVKDMNLSIQKQMENLFIQESSIFFGRALMEKDAIHLKDNVCYCQRLCEILDINIVPVLQKLMKN